MGNILTEDLTAIWTGPRYQTFRRQLKEQGPFRACLRCCNLTADVAPAMPVDVPPSHAGLEGL
jgi:hypothetical protein